MDSDKRGEYSDERHNVMETDTNLTAEEAQFLLEHISKQGVPFGHPDGHYILSIGDSCVAKLYAITQKQEIVNAFEQ